MLLAPIIVPPTPTPMTNTSSMNTSSTNGVAPLCGLPTKEVASAEVPAVPASPATPTLDENLPPTISVSEPSAEAKLNPQPPAPTTGLVSTPASEIEPNSAASVANVPFSPVTGCPTAVTSKVERIQGEPATTGSATGNPVIARSSETIELATVETGDAKPTHNSPASKAIVDAVPPVSLEKISDGLPPVNDAKAATSEVVDEPAAGRERPSPSMSRLAELPTSSRFAFEGYRHFITSVSSSGTGTDKFSLDEFGRGLTPLSSTNIPSLGSRTSGKTTSAADSLQINVEKLDPSHSVISESALSPEHRKKQETTSASSASLPVVYPQKVIAQPSGTVSDQLAAAIVERLDSARDSSPPTFRLRLNPRELGTVEVHLSVVHDVVSIRFVAQDEAARQIIERQLDDLRQSLTNSGVSFSQCHVGCNSDGRHPPDQQQTAPPSIARTSPMPSRWSRLRDHEHQVALPQGRLNVVV